MTTHYFSAGLYAKETRIPAGHIAGQHRHTYSHLSILACGSARLTVDGVSTEYTAPACIEIAANKTHMVTALTDVTWFCIHATECTDAEHVDELLIAKG